MHKHLRDYTFGEAKEICQKQNDCSNACPFFNRGATAGEGFCKLYSSSPLYPSDWKLDDAYDYIDETKKLEDYSLEKIKKICEKTKNCSECIFDTKDGCFADEYIIPESSNSRPCFWSFPRYLPHDLYKPLEDYTLREIEEFCSKQNGVCVNCHAYHRRKCIFQTIY